MKYYLGRWLVGWCCVVDGITLIVCLGLWGTNLQLRVALYLVKTNWL